MSRGRDGRGEARVVPEAEPRSYYGRPVIKPPVWKPEIPWYFFAGGLCGGSAALAVAAEASGNRPLARRSWLIALAAGTASPALLIADLGRPERFLNMLRVFKPTSPMSVGSWILVATGGAAALATARETFGIWPRAGRLAGVSAGVLGLPLSTYTAALIANTAVPVWHEARRELPFVFAGSSAASAGAAAAVLTPARHAAPARRLALVGVFMETISVLLMERRLGALAEPFRSGAAGRCARAAKAANVSGAAVVARGRGRSSAVVGGVLLLAGSVLERWAVFKAGFQSAREPRYTVEPQRRRAKARA